MRNRVPIIYLVDSAGVNLPYQGGVFPGQYGAARIFYYNSIMRRYLKVPQISAVMGMCVAGGAYLPALSDVILMVEGTSFMGLGGANLVKGATGQTIDNETLGGAMTHNSISGVAHYHTKDEPECIEKIRQLVSELPNKDQTKVSIIEPKEPKNKPEKLYEILPEDHRAGYDMREVLNCFLDDGELDEFQADYAKEMICGTARIAGIQVGSSPIIAEWLRKKANRRSSAESFIPNRRKKPRILSKTAIVIRRRFCLFKTFPVLWSARTRNIRASFAPARVLSKRWRRRPCRNWF